MVRFGRIAGNDHTAAKDTFPGKLVDELAKVIAMDKVLRKKTVKNNE